MKNKEHITGDENLKLQIFIQGESVTPFKVMAAISHDGGAMIQNTDCLCTYLKQQGWEARSINDATLDDIALEKAVRKPDFEINPENIQIEVVDMPSGRGYMVVAESNITIKAYVKAYEQAHIEHTSRRVAAGEER